MRVLLLTPHYPPEIRSVSVLMSQLAEDLAAAGHAVTVVTPYPPANMDEARGQRAASEATTGVRVIRVPVLPFVKVAPTVRAVTHFTLAASMLAAGWRAGRHDVILAYSPPLTVALACEALGRRWGAPFILNVQDLYPQTLIDLGLVRSPVVIGTLRWLERRAYRHAGAITVHSAGNRDHLVERAVAPEKVRIIPNWVDTATPFPGPMESTFRSELGLGDRFVVAFAGVMGYAQDMQVIIEAATLLRDERDIVFLLVGDGVRRREAEEAVHARGLDAVRFLPFQPLERYALLIHAADCCLVTLQASVATPVVPSKIAGILAASRPVVAALPSGDARELVTQSRGGVCVAPGDASGLAEAIRGLARDRDRRLAMGQAGHQYVEAHFSRAAAVSIYERLIEEIAGTGAAGHRAGYCHQDSQQPNP